MRFREGVEDFGWLLLIPLLPLAIPIGLGVFLFMLGQRLVWGRQQYA